MHTRPLIHYSHSRQPPKEVIQHLRQIHPATELVYLGGGLWLLGKVRWNQYRYQKGRQMLKRLAQVANPNPQQFRMAALVIQGFAPVELYEQAEPDSRITEDFREREWRLQHCPDDTFKARLAETSGEIRRREQLAEAREAARAVSGDAWRYAFKKPVSIVKPTPLH